MSHPTDQLAEIVRGRQLLRDGRGRRLREQADLGLRECCRMTGLSPASVSAWERGLCKPSPSNAAKWARLMDQIQLALRTEADAQPHAEPLEDMAY